MTASPDLNGILEDLAAGRIDAAEAGRRIDALSTAESSAEPTIAEAAPPVDETSDGTPTEPGAESSQDTDSADETEELPSPEAWAAATDRPQTPGAARDSFPTSPPASSAASNGATAADKPTGTQGSSSASAAGETGQAKPGRGWLGRPRTPATGTGGVEKLSVRAVGRRVRIVGEPSVATVSADGPHVLRRNGSVLEVSSDGEFGASIDGFQLLRATRSLDDFRSLGLGKELLLKVNPALLVDVEVTAGSLSTEGVPRLGSIRVTAGGARLLDVSEIADALVQAGQATVKAAITGGRSRIRVESGSLNLQLSDASNVTISTDSQLGKISWAGAHAGFTGDEVVMGNGSARLEVEVVMGHASVRAGTVPAGSGATSSGAA